MEYTLNEGQIKFLEAILGGMSEEDYVKYILAFYKEKDAKKIIKFVEGGNALILYKELSLTLCD